MGRQAPRPLGSLGQGGPRGDMVPPVSRNSRPGREHGHAGGVGRGDRRVAGRVAGAGRCGGTRGISTGGESMKRAKWHVRNEAREAEVWLYDEIGEDWWGDGMSAKAFIEDLMALPSSVETIVVRINSPGGDVFEGFAMYQALLRHRAKIVTAIDALAASAASVVAMAGDEINAATTSMVMVHDPWSIGIGNAEDFRQLADTLDQVTESIVAAYA